jgi:hypothetical protein
MESISNILNTQVLSVIEKGSSVSICRHVHAKSNRVDIVTTGSNVRSRLHMETASNLTRLKGEQA